MIRFTILFLLFLHSGISDTIGPLYSHYQKGEYEQACNYGLFNLKKIDYNEASLSLYAFACLKADRIDQLSYPISRLTQSQEARANASYFSLLVLQKKLLLQSLYDHYSLKPLKLPSSSHLLSKIFAYYQQDPQANQEIKEYYDPTNPRISYKLYKLDTNGQKTIAIDEYYDKILTLHHTY